jgi:hypothetical protein
MMMMLPNSTNSQNQSQNGQESHVDADSVMRFNYFTAMCVTTTGLILLDYGIFLYQIKDMTI